VRFQARPWTHSLVPLDNGQVLLWEGRDFALHNPDGSQAGTYSIGPERLLRQFMLTNDHKTAYAVCLNYDQGQRLLKLDLTKPGSTTDLGPVPEGEHPFPELPRIRMDQLCDAMPAKNVLGWQISGRRLEKTDVVGQRDVPSVLGKSSRVIPGMTQRIGSHEVSWVQDGFSLEKNYHVRLQHEDRVTSALGLETRERSYVAVGTAGGEVLLCDLDGGVERFRLGSPVDELLAGPDRIYAVGEDGAVGVVETPGSELPGRGGGVLEQEEGILVGSVRLGKRLKDRPAPPAA
jgi:hypothetical protein